MYIYVICDCSVYCIRNIVYHSVRETFSTEHNNSKNIYLFINKISMLTINKYISIYKL